MILLYLTLLAAAAPPVAIIGSLSGEAARTSEGSALKELAWLTPGDDVTLRENASMVIVLMSGKRYQVEGPARFRIQRDSVQALSGKLTLLPQLPPLPQFAVAASGTRAAAVRVRGKSAGQRMTPNSDVVVLSDQVVVLRYDPGTTRFSHYRFEIEDKRGKLIFERQSDSAELRLPANVLAPGEVYTWLISGLKTSAETILGWETIQTLHMDQVRRRQKFQEQILQDPLWSKQAPALMREVDRNLRLVTE